MCQELYALKDASHHLRSPRVAAEAQEDQTLRRPVKCTRTCPGSGSIIDCEYLVRPGFPRGGYLGLHLRKYLSNVADSEMGEQTPTLQQMHPVTLINSWSFATSLGVS